MQKELTRNPGTIDCYFTKKAALLGRSSSDSACHFEVFAFCETLWSNYCKCSQGTNPSSAQRSKCLVRLRDYEISSRLVKVISKFKWLDFIVVVAQMQPVGDSFAAAQHFDP